MTITVRRVLQWTILSFIYLLFYSSPIFGQDTAIIYFNSNYEKVKSSKAKFLHRIITYPKSYRVEEFTIDKNLVSILNMKSLNPPVENGLSEYFDNNGKPYAIGYYKEGFMDSIWILRKSKENLTTFDTISYSGIKSHYLNRNRNFKDNPTYQIVKIMPAFNYGNEISLNRLSLQLQVDSLLKIMDSYLDMKDPEFLKVHTSYVSTQGKIIEAEANNFQKYINENIHYPVRAKKGGVSGSVYVQFVINSEGKVIEPTILRGINKDLDYEAIRLFINSPKWQPGIQNDESVRVSMVFPVKFK